MKTFLTLFTFLLAATVQAATGTLSATNFATRTNTVADADLMLAENTNRPSPFKTISFPTANLFSNRINMGRTAFRPAASQASTVPVIEVFTNTSSGTSSWKVLIDGTMIPTTDKQFDLGDGGFHRVKRAYIATNLTSEIAINNGDAYIFGNGNANQVLIGAKDGSAGELRFGAYSMRHNSDYISYTINSGGGAAPMKMQRAAVGHTNGVWFLSADFNGAIAGINATGTNQVQVNKNTNTCCGDFRANDISGIGTTYVNAAVVTNGLQSRANNLVAPSVVAVGASPFNYTNTGSFNLVAYIYNGQITDIKVNGAAIYTGGTLTSHLSTVMLQTGEYITITYSSAPSMVTKLF
jgi:hypothetical protein